MKSLRNLLPLLLLSTAVIAQTDAQNPGAHSHTSAPAVQSDAQQAFTILKTLAGYWQGPVTTSPPIKEMGNGENAAVTLRVTSRGNALVHEMFEPGKADDPAKYDHPVTMFYLDSDRLTLVHYCDAGNRPRMVAKASPDGKKIEFDFVDLSGGNQHGHMYHAVFTILDANHHIEDWTYMMPGDKPLVARIDLRRQTSAQATSGQ